jgi:tRNA pseudouridine38-40 synthase
VRRIALTIEYDGTDFAGFQTQGQGERTVQSVLNDAICKLTQAQSVVVHPAGRTDSGVHALGQVAHFDTDSDRSATKLIGGLNGILPRDVCVKELWEPEGEFHARFSATRRTYVYAILTRPQRSAILDRYSLHETKTLDLQLMRNAARAVQGTHDFKSFANRGGDPGSTTVRRVDRLQLRHVRNGEMLLVMISGNAFLRSMVRNIVGILLDVGRGHLQPAQVQEILMSADREKNPCQTVAAKGLCLLKVDYAGLERGINADAASDEEG